MNEDKRNQSGRYTDFPAAAPESNVNRPGRPQSSHGSATEPVPGGTGNAARAGDSMQSVATGVPDQTPDDAAVTADRGTSRRDG
jgi:hypothetical protein